MYSTWFSVPPRGYCERSLRRGCARGLYRGGPASWLDSELCCDETPVRPVPVDGVLLLELGSEVRSVSEVLMASGGCGDRAEGREFCDMPEPEREEGNEDSEVRRLDTACAALAPGAESLASLPKCLLGAVARE